MLVAANSLLDGAEKDLASPNTKEDERSKDDEHPALKLRRIAHQGILKQANKMIERSNRRLGSLVAGDNVLVGKK